MNTLSLTAEDILNHPKDIEKALEILESINLTEGQVDELLKEQDEEFLRN